jgi:hypothetical protein
MVIGMIADIFNLPNAMKKAIIAGNNLAMCYY